MTMILNSQVGFLEKKQDSSVLGLKLPTLQARTSKGYIWKHSVSQDAGCFTLRQSALLALGANQKRLRREALSVFKLTFDRFARCIGLRLQSLSTHTPSEAIRIIRNDAVRRIMSLRMRKRMVGARVTSSLTSSDLPLM